MGKLAIQDQYPEDMSLCYGCGSLNDHGLHIKSYWSEDGEHILATYTPQPYHIAIPGYVYGGLLASLIDCHGTGAAAAAACKAQNRPIGAEPPLRFVTGNLNIRYLQPTPLSVPLELEATIIEIKGTKITVDITLSANGQITVTGQVIAFQVPKGMINS